jgi:hypothetical protein
MERMLALHGATLGGWLGWAVGSTLSLYAGLVVSLVGSGLGIWLAGYIVREHF